MTPKQRSLPPNNIATENRALTITIVGPGALGCLFAAFLSKAGHSVWILDHSPLRANKIARQGICLIAANPQFYPVRSTVSAEEIGRSDVVLLCVKSYDVEDALGLAAPLLKGGPLLIALQNGLGHHEVLRSFTGLCWAVGLTSQGASLLKPGVVKHGGYGQTTLGFIDKVDLADCQRLQTIANLFNSAQLPCTISSDIHAAVWDKLLVNVGINALTALHNCPNGELLTDKPLRVQLRQAVEEATRIALAKGVNISPRPIARTEQVCKDTKTNISSMLQDIRQHRRTEIGSINGVIVSEAASLGIAVPMNKFLTEEVQALQRKCLADT